MTLSHPLPMASHDVAIELGAVTLGATLLSQRGAHGLILLPYIERPGRRGRYSHRLVRALHTRDLATFAVDLTTDAEAYTHGPRDHDELARRLVGATDWIRSSLLIQNLPIGYVAGVALRVAIVAAAARPQTVRFTLSVGDLKADVGTIARRAASAFLRHHVPAPSARSTIGARPRRSP